MLKMYYKPTFILTFIILLIYTVDFNISRDRIAPEQKTNIELHELEIIHELNDILSDTNFITTSSTLKDFVLKSDSRKEVTRFIEEFHSNHSQYDQIRFIDKSGQEVLRSNNRNLKTWITKPENLQNKSNRDYFLKAIHLPKNEFYLSSFNLNIENNKIEQPLRPVIRLSKPLFINDKRYGIIVFNYNAQLLIEHLIDSNTDNLDHFYLLDENFDWLVDTLKDREFKHLTNPTQAKSFIAQYKIPAQFRKFQYFQNESGIFSIKKINIAQKILEEAKSKGQNFVKINTNLALYLVAHRTTDFYGFGHYRVELYSVIYVLCLIILWSFIYSYLKERSQRKENEALSKTILKSAPTAIISIDATGIIQIFNPAAEEMFGHSSEEAIGSNINILMPEPHFSRHDNYLLNYKSRDESHIVGIERVEVQAKKKDGSLFHVAVSIEEMFIGDQKYFTGIFRDLTTEKESEKLANEYNEKMLQSLNEQKVINDLLFIETSYKVTLKQKIYQVLNVLKEVEWLRNIEDACIYIYNDKDEIFELLASRGHNQEYFEKHETTFFGTCACGELLTMEPATHKHEESSDQVKFQHLNFPIIRGIKFYGYLNIYQEDLFLNDEQENFLTLCVEIIANMIKLHNDEETLILEKEKAEKAEKAKSLFLANMSHEIRTPMNGIIGMIELLQEESISNEHKKKLSIMKSSGDSMLAIINDILNFTKLESGKAIVESTPVNLKNLFEEIFEVFQPSCEQKGIDIKIDFPDNFPKSILSDKVKITQILYNLISNASKFTHKGFIKIGMRVVNENTASYKLELYVEDSGIGIASENMEKLFDYFEQADTSTTRMYGGTGLGLSIVKKLAELLGGGVDIDSTLEEGTTLKVQLIVNKDNEQVSTQETSKTQDQDWSHLRVLIAEDNKTNQVVIKSFLKKLNIKPFVANNGQEALEYIKSNPIDLIFMDCHMPVLDGHAATEEIRKLSEISQPKIIALSASILQENVDHCYAVGMNDFLGKPVKKKDIETALRKHFNQE